MQKKSNAVLHFKLKPSKRLFCFYVIVYIAAFLITFFSSVDWWFKALLISLLLLEFIRQQTKKLNANSIIEIEFRDNNAFLKRQQDNVFQSIKKWTIKQNRIFAEIQLHLDDEICTEIYLSDRFQSKHDFSQLLQQLRFKSP